MKELDCIEIASRGRTFRVPSVVIEGKKVIVTGGLIKTARILDDEFVEGELVDNPPTFISKLFDSGLNPDIVTFPQKIYERNPKYSYPFEWDNAAVATTKSFDEWWASLPQETRKNIRRAGKRNVVVELSKFDDDLIKGIKEIYNEIPVRQGKLFWHYGKNLETIKRENMTYLERSEFIGAYYNGELIGFMKFVYVDKIANIMQILSKASHHDKRPMNALIAKAVEVCQAKGILYLVYGKFTYGNKDKSTLAEFKRRNGFMQMDFPRYFIPLTLTGKVFLRLNLHRGIVGLLPSGVLVILGRARAAMLRVIKGRRVYSPS